tara:strand:- start:1 stop:195 length:195 start_codon:yes stop_codon:yes gene_type:complete
MIDIDKIQLDYRRGYKFSRQSNRWNVIPDLLAEVKRLRKAIIEVAFDEHESVYEMKQALVEVIE